MVLNKEGGEKVICQGCGQEFTPKRGSDSQNLCPKCFIKKLDNAAKRNPANPGIDPAASKTMTDQPTDQPKPTTPGAPPEPPAVPPTGKEPTETPPPEGPTPTPGAPAPGIAPQPEEEKKEEGGGEAPTGGPSPVA